MRRTALLLAAVFATACSTEPMSPDRCTGVPPVILTPEDATIQVGDTVLAKVTLNGPVECRPINMTLRTLRWQASDETVARVSAIKGYVVAKSPGETIITVFMPNDSMSWGAIHIRVLP